MSGDGRAVKARAIPAASPVSSLAASSAARERSRGLRRFEGEPPCVRVRKARPRLIAVCGFTGFLIRWARSAQVRVRASGRSPGPPFAADRKYGRRQAFPFRHPGHDTRHGEPLDLRCPRVLPLRPHDRMTRGRRQRRPSASPGLGPRSAGIGQRAARPPGRPPQAQGASLPAKEGTGAGRRPAFPGSEVTMPEAFVN